MKRPILLFVFLFLFCILYFPANAQCTDCLKKDKTNDSRFAAGITLHSNNHYGIYENPFVKQQPLEFNFRYKVGNNHVVRMSIPIAIKVDLGDYATFFNKNYRMYNGKESLEDYYESMKTDVVPFYYQTIEFNYSLYGIALGYDYNYSFIPAFSAFGGIELAYYHLISKINYCKINYIANVHQYNGSSIVEMEYMNWNEHCNAGIVKPLLGIRYQFQKLLFEASIGYSFYGNSSTIANNDVCFNPSSKISDQKSDNQVISSDVQRRFEYQISLYYSF